MFVRVFFRALRTPRWRSACPASRGVTSLRRLDCSTSMRPNMTQTPILSDVLPFLKAGAVVLALGIIASFMVPSHKLPGAWGNVSDVMGFTYTVAWSYSFYPQFILNQRRRCARHAMPSSPWRAHRASHQENTLNVHTGSVMSLLSRYQATHTTPPHSQPHRVPCASVQECRGALHRLSNPQSARISLLLLLQPSSLLHPCSSARVHGNVQQKYPCRH
jgi:hypothetical protein